MKFNNFGADVGCDPNAINNNTPNLNTSLSDSRCPIPVSKDIPPEIENLMNDKSRTVNLGMQELDGDEIETTLDKTRGYTLPKHINAKPEDMIDLTKFREEIRSKYRIFICRNFRTKRSITDWILSSCRRSVAPSINQH